MSKKKIAFICNNITPNSGGTERVTFKISNELDKIGFESYFIYSNKDNNNIPQYKKARISIKDRSNKIKTILSEFIKQNNINILVVVNQIYQGRKFQHIYSYLKKENNINIIACFHNTPDFWKKSDKINYVLPKIYMKSRLKRIICYLYNKNKIRAKGMYNICDNMILLSKRYIHPFQQIYNINDSETHKIIAIPNPCPFTDNYSGEQKQKVVLIVARMAEIQKRIYLALKIWRKVTYKHPDWILKIVGDGPQLNDYKRYVNRKKIPNVTFVGESSEVTLYYKQSKIFMMTSIWEGQPMTLIESMHYGCVPIVIDSFESIHDLIIDNVNGIICKNNNINDFIQKLDSLLQNETIIEKYSSYNLSSENQLFSSNNIIKKWLLLLNK